MPSNNFAFLVAVFVCAFNALSNRALALSPVDKNWADLETRGVAALDANEYGIAEQLLKKAIAQAQDFRPTDMRLPKSIAELGRLYTIRGQFSKAALYLEAELKVKEQLLRNKQYQCIPTMGSLIQFYFNSGMQNKSVPLTMKMLSLINSRLKTNQTPVIEWAVICDAVGDRYYSAHNFALADKLFKTALNIKTTLLSSNHLSLANSYERMGNICLQQNEPAQAEQYFSHALKITEKILPPGSHEIQTRLDLVKAAQNQTSLKTASTAPSQTPSQKSDKTAIPFVIVLQKSPKICEPSTILTPLGLVNNRHLLGYNT